MTMIKIRIVRRMKIGIVMRMKIRIVTRMKIGIVMRMKIRIITRTMSIPTFQRTVSFLSIPSKILFCFRPFITWKVQFTQSMR